MDTVNKTYPELQFPASELSAFAVTINYFIISLKNGEIVHFEPDDVQSFYDWLIVNGVRDIREKEVLPLVVAPRERQSSWFKRKR